MPHSRPQNPIPTGYAGRLRARMGHERVMLPGVRAVVLDNAQRVLLQRRMDTGSWGLPGGAVEIGETALQALRREVSEETGLQVGSAHPLALHSGRTQAFQYPNGDQVQCFAVSFIVRDWSGIPTADGQEGSELRFWDFNNLPENLVPIHRETLDACRRYTGQFILPEEDNESTNNKETKMTKLPETILNAWDAHEGPIVLTTTDAEGVPNAIYATCTGRFGEDRLVVADNYFDKTRRNARAGGIGSILFMTAEGKAYQVKGRLEYHQEGPIFDDMKKWNSEKHPGHAALAVCVETVYSGAEKLV